MPRGTSQRPQCQLSSLSSLLERATFISALWRWQCGCNSWLNVRTRLSTTFTLLSLPSEEKWVCFEPFENGGTEGCGTSTKERKGYCTSMFREEPSLEKNLFRSLKTKSVRKGRSGPKEHCLSGDEKNSYFGVPTVLEILEILENFKSVIYLEKSWR